MSKILTEKQRMRTVWSAMMGRCYDQKNNSFRHYGGRGIRVCKRWHTFENFFADIGCRPKDKWSIDRINYDGNYSPSNTRWADPETQIANRRVTLWATAWGERKTIHQWSLDPRVTASIAAIRLRLLKGVDEHSAVSMPPYFRRGEITAFGETKRLKDWCKDPRCAVSPTCLLTRINLLGWDPESAISKPKYHKKTNELNIINHQGDEQ